MTTYKQIESINNAMDGEKVSLLATTVSVNKLYGGSEEYWHVTCRSEDTDFRCRVRTVKISACTDLLKMNTLVTIRGKIAKGINDEGTRTILADDALAVGDKDEWQTEGVLPAHQPPKRDWERIGLGSHDEWLFFVMKSRNLPPGIALWPQYRFRIDAKEYRVDFALVDTINCEIISLIEIDGKQHKESVLEDRLRQHAIEKHSGAKIDRIDTETVRAMARKEGLL